MQGYTRQETLALTKTTSSRLAYLDRTGIVVPEKYGNSKKPTVIYSWEQLLEIRAINDLRKEISLQTVRKIMEFLQGKGFDATLRDKRIAVVDGEAFWVRPDLTDLNERMMHIMQVSSKGKKKTLGQFILVVLPAFADVIDDIWKNAKRSKVIDMESFKRRAKAQPSDAA